MEKIEKVIFDKEQDEYSYIYSLLLTRNVKLISMYKEYMLSIGNDNRKIEKYIALSRQYFNIYLPRNYVNLEEGVKEEYLDGFFSKFLMKEHIWLTSASLIETSLAIKSFYSFMLKEEYISNEEYENIDKIYNNHLANWIDLLESIKYIDNF